MITACPMLILYLSLNKKHYIPFIMSMKKEELRLIFCTSSSLAIMILKLLLPLADHGLKNPLVIWFLNFRSGDTCLEDQTGRGRPSAIDTQHLKILIERNYVKVSEKCLR